MSSVDKRLSGPKDIGRSCPKVITVDLASLSNMKIGMLSYEEVSIGRLSPDTESSCNRTSQNSLKNCLHIPQGLAGGLISVATATARMSPFFAPYILSASGSWYRRGWIYLHNSGRHGHPLRTGRDRVRCILDIGALHERAVGEQDGAADPEVGVRACEMSLVMLFVCGSRLLAVGPFFRFSACFRQLPDVARGQSVDRCCLLLTMRLAVVGHIEQKSRRGNGGVIGKCRCQHMCVVRSTEKME